MVTSAAFDDELGRLRLLEARYDPSIFRRLSLFGPLAGTLCLIVAAQECRSETGTVLTTASFDSNALPSALPPRATAGQERPCVDLRDVACVERAFRADPRRCDALRASRRHEFAEPTVPGET